MSKHILSFGIWSAAALVVLGVTFFLWKNSQPRRYPALANGVGKQDADQRPPGDDEDDPTRAPDTTTVSVVHPRSGAMERITVQVGSVEADEVHLHSQVTGILKDQSVLIGASVKRGMVLAVVDVPELEKQAERNAAVVEQAKARVEQMKAKVAIARADLEASKADVVYSEAQARAATATVVFRATRFKQVKALAETNSIEGVVFDIETQKYDAAKESENAAKAAIVTSRAKSMSADAKIHLTLADVVEAEAQVKIAQADLEKTQVQIGFARIVAPFDGIITQRTLYPGALVRAAGERGAQLPLLTIQRTDLMRVVVQIPDREVPYADMGDPAYVEIDAFPGERFDAKVSRIAKAEDPQTRLMAVEIDLPNPQGRIRQGMFGKATILLDRATDQLSIPSSCLAGKSKTREGSIFVVRNGKACRTKVRLGMDNGERVEVLQGLTSRDDVILAPPTGLSEGLEVTATLIEETRSKGDN